jgi:hypothetical protein
MELPLYILDIDEYENDQTCVFAVGLVSQPAIERNWMAFASEKQFEVVNEEQRILAGYLMIADQPIYRRDPDGSEYYVSFPAKSIEKIVNKYSKVGKPLSFNFDHSEVQTQSAYLLSHFMIDSKMGINSPAGFTAAPDGSWFGFVKVPDEKEWIEAKKRKGFSVEGYFTDIKLLDAEQEVLEGLKNKLINNDMNKTNVEKTLGKGLFSKLAKMFEGEEAPAEVQLETTKLADGSATIKGKIMEGETVTLVAEDGTESPAPDGSHELEGGVKITVASGVITAVEKEEAEMPMSEEAVLSAIQSAITTQTEVFNKHLADLKANHAAELKAVEEKTKSLFEAVTILASVESEEIETKEDPKGKAKILKKNNFSKIQGIIGKLQTN